MRVQRNEPRDARHTLRPAHARTGGQAGSAGRPARQHSEIHRCCGLAKRLAAHHYQVTLSDIAAATRRSRRVARARHVAIYLAHVALGLPLAEVAAEFSRDRTTAGYACRVVEDARDDPAFDAAVAELELCAAALLELEHDGAAP